MNGLNGLKGFTGSSGLLILDKNNSWSGTNTFTNVTNCNSAINVTGTASFASVNVFGVTSSASFLTTSDYRIKDIFCELDHSFHVDLLRPVHYMNKKTQTQDIGLIAHELQTHYPYLVTGQKDGQNLQSVNYIGIIGILIHEIQCLKKKRSTSQIGYTTSASNSTNIAFFSNDNWLTPLSLSLDRGVWSLSYSITLAISTDDFPNTSYDGYLLWGISDATNTLLQKNNSYFKIIPLQTNTYPTFSNSLVITFATYANIYINCSFHDINNHHFNNISIQTTSIIATRIA